MNTEYTPRGSIVADDGTILAPLGQFGYVALNVPMGVPSLDDEAKPVKVDTCPDCKLSLVECTCAKRRLRK